MADQSIEVPGGANINNFANVTRIVEIAEAAEVDAVWAGWGHASENPSLPERLARSGILFLGPSAGPMKSLGDKIDATLIAQSAHVPTLPWNGSNVTVDVAALRDANGSVVIPDSVYDSVTIHSLEEARDACRRLQYPLMIKASEGGGGKGIRTLNDESELDSAWNAVRSEVPGSPIFVMRLAERCRHLEVQLLADHYGHVVALSGRDCSVQRRHQKIIEEGPPLTPSAEVWNEMQLAAVRLAKLVGYSNAGTVEYLYMPDNTFSFLELNPRLQVEHPVTEMIMNVNLPAAQLQIAMGIPLYCIGDIRRLYGEDEEGTDGIDFDAAAPVSAKGHVIACRITAENPEKGFQPTSGAIRELNFRSTANVWGYFSVDGNGRVHEYADSQFGHLFSWGASRDIARKNMVQALREFSIRGEIMTPLATLLQLLQSERYVRNEIDTGWLDGLIGGQLPVTKPDACFVALVAAACHSAVSFAQKKADFCDLLRRGQIPPRELLSVETEETLVYEEVKYTFRAFQSGEDRITLQANESAAELQVTRLPDGGFLLRANDTSHVAYLQETKMGIRLTLDGVSCLFAREWDPAALRAESGGKLVRFLVRVGDHVTRGDVFAEMEVMKMYLPLRTQESGVVTSLTRAPGSVVQGGEVVGSLQLDDASHAHPLTCFSLPLPCLLPHPPRHVQQRARESLRSLIACLDGYWTTRDQANNALKTLLAAVKEPALAFADFEDILSTIENKLPEEMKKELHQAMEDHSSFPADPLRQVIRKYTLCDASLQMTVSPLMEMINRNANLPGSFIVDCFFSLLERFLEDETPTEGKTDDDSLHRQWRRAFRHERSEGLDDLLPHLLDLLSEHVPRSRGESSRLTSLLQKAGKLSTPAGMALEARQLLLERSLPSREEEMAGTLAALREAVNGPPGSPPGDTQGEWRERMLERLAGGREDVSGALMGVMRCETGALRGAAVECYLRKIYGAYVLGEVRAWGETGFRFRFSQEAVELPMGARVGDEDEGCESDNEEDEEDGWESEYDESDEDGWESDDHEGGDESGHYGCETGDHDETGNPIHESTHPNHETTYHKETANHDTTHDETNHDTTHDETNHDTTHNETDNPINDTANPNTTHHNTIPTLQPSAEGAILLTTSLASLHRLLPSLLASFPPSPRPRNALHILLLHPPRHLPATYARFLRRHLPALSRASVARVTFTDTSDPHPLGARWPLPSSFTFPSSRHFAEDPLVRHIEPPLAHLLELPRLRRFHVQLVPLPDRSIHLYRATPRGPFPPRFFVRAVCPSCDPLGAVSLPDSYPSVEKTLVDALDALDMALRQARFRGETGLGGSHVFLNVLPATTAEVGQIEGIVRSLHRRYETRLKQLLVARVEMRLRAALRTGAAPMPVRMVGRDPTGMALRVDTYVETRDMETGEVIFTAINDDGNGVWESESESEGEEDVGGDYGEDRYDGYPHNGKEPMESYPHNGHKNDHDDADGHMDNDRQAGVVRVHRNASSTKDNSNNLIHDTINHLTDTPNRKYDSSNNQPIDQYHNQPNQSIDQSTDQSTAEWDGKPVSTPYPPQEPLERQRAAARRSGTLYCYDFLDLLRHALARRWRHFLRQTHRSPRAAPATLLHATELTLSGCPGSYSLREVVRPPGLNELAVVAWQLTLFPPDQPAGREILLLCNDITLRAGSFGTREDALFQLVSQRAREKGIPRIFFAANSGARIGLAEEVKRRFRVKWLREDDPASGVDFLYLSEADYRALRDSVVADPIQLHDTLVYRLRAVLGAESDLGVENLAGSGLIAGETRRAYKEIFTLTVVTGRSVGIGAYLVRLGQRTLQKTHHAPIILTGYEALNQLMGRRVYSSNEQLGGTAIMAPNGVTHLCVDSDREAVETLLRWLAFVPRSSRASPLPLPSLRPRDSFRRPVTFQPSREPYDIRGLLAGCEDASGIWRGGLFDRGSFLELLGAWAKTVVVGRARLGGMPVGVVATESRTVEAAEPADPAQPLSETRVVQQAGGVWFPDSAFKTAQAIEDINREGLPLFVVANWRGFSGGARDMFDQVLKFGSAIVDQLVDFRQPVFVYIPPLAELRGGAFVVVDSHINSEVMEMYADPLARAGVLEPPGVVAIKFREGDRKAAMQRCDPLLQTLVRSRDDADDDVQRKEAEKRVQAREKLLRTPFQQVAEEFADLHDRAERMQAVGAIRRIVPLAQARVFFYWRLRRRLLEMQLTREVGEVAHCSTERAKERIETWFWQDHKRSGNHCNVDWNVDPKADSNCEKNDGRLHSPPQADWDDDELVTKWIEKERSQSIQTRMEALSKQTIRNHILDLGSKNPDTVAEGVLDLLAKLPDDVKEQFVSTLKRGVQLQNQPQTDYVEEDQLVEF